MLDFDFLKSKKLFKVKKGLEMFLHHVLCMIFQEKCFSCYILLSDQISLSDCLYFLRYLAIYVLELFVSQVVRSQILKLTLPL